MSGVPFEESDEAVNVYPIATLADSANAGLAKDFVDLVTSDEGQQALRDAGFARP
ncbi:MAG: substrate-binding domain-containing protein [Nocardioidaceae bacterium]